MGEQITPSSQIEAAIEIVEAVYGPDPEGRHIDIVSAIFAAIRANAAERHAVA